jgi:hypothetical protein
MKKEFIINLNPIYERVKKELKDNEDVYTIEDFPFYRDIIIDYVYDIIIEKIEEKIKKMLLTKNQ